MSGCNCFNPIRNCKECHENISNPNDLKVTVVVGKKSKRREFDVYIKNAMKNFKHPIGSWY